MLVWSITITCEGYEGGKGGGLVLCVCVRVCIHIE